MSFTWTDRRYIYLAKYCAQGPARFWGNRKESWPGRARILCRNFVPNNEARRPSFNPRWDSFLQFGNMKITLIELDIFSWYLYINNLSMDFERIYNYKLKSNLFIWYPASILPIRIIARKSVLMRLHFPVDSTGHHSHLLLLFSPCPQLIESVQPKFHPEGIPIHFPRSASADQGIDISSIRFFFISFSVFIVFWPSTVCCVITACNWNLYITVVALAEFSVSAVQALTYENGDYMGSLNKKVSGAQCIIMGFFGYRDWTPNGISFLEHEGYNVSSYQVFISCCWIVQMTLMRHWINNCHYHYCTKRNNILLFNLIYSIRHMHIYKSNYNEKCWVQKHNDRYSRMETSLNTDLNVQMF